MPAAARRSGFSSNGAGWAPCALMCLHIGLWGNENMHQLQAGIAAHLRALNRQVVVQAAAAVVDALTFRHIAQHKIHCVRCPGHPYRRGEVAALTLRRCHLQRPKIFLVRPPVEPALHIPQ